MAKQMHPSLILPSAKQSARCNGVKCNLMDKCGFDGFQEKQYFSDCIVPSIKFGGGVFIVWVVSQELDLAPQFQ